MLHVWHKEPYNSVQINAAGRFKIKKNKKLSVIRYGELNANVGVWFGIISGK